MAKKSKSQSVPAPAPSTQTKPSTITFPDISAKYDLECRVLQEDQILLIDDLFTVEECKRFIKFIETLPLELTPPKKKGEADRLNHRLSITSVPFAKELHSVIAPYLPDFPYPTSSKRSNAGSRPAHSLNFNIRLYKYTPGQYFGAHYDDSVRDPETGARSEWTLLIYLSGVEDGVKGGETLFYEEQRNQPREVITPPLNRGTALLHRHGNECMLHEGSPIQEGIKYVLRSDLMFMQ